MSIENRFRMLLAVSLVALVAVPVTHAQYSGGSGTADDPYQIATADDLIALGETPDDYDKHFILTADLDFDPNLPGRKVFDRAVIAPDTNDVAGGFQGTPFIGVFDGDEHTISHLTIEGDSFLGLFGWLDSTAIVLDLGLKEADINGTGGYIGGLAGECFGSISNCHSMGRINGAYCVGGFVGSNGFWRRLEDGAWARFGSITESYSSCLVTGNSSVGGLVGCNYGHISMSFSSGQVVGGEGYSTGGLVGENYGDIIASHSNGNIDGQGSVGGLVGHSHGEDAYITACYTTGSVHGTIQVGGLIGESEGPVIACYSAASVSGKDRVGGLVGESNHCWVVWPIPYGSITSCFSTGVVSAETCVGGLVGYNHEALVANCYSTGLVSGDQEVGGLVGGSYQGYSDASFWNICTSGQSDSKGGTGLTTAEMQTALTFLEAGWDFMGETENGPNDVWKIVEGQTYPLLSWQQYGGGTGEPNDPYLIYTAEHLNALGAEPNDYGKHFQLMADVDLSGYVYDRAVIAPDMNDAVIGDYGVPFDGTPFCGTFDGTDHTISHLTIRGVYFLGLFGALSPEAEVCDLTLHASDVCGTRGTGFVGTGFAGALAGSNSGTVTASRSSGMVSGGGFVGGLVGANGGSIMASCSTCTVTGGSNIGGLVGRNSGSGAVMTSFSSGAVSGSRDVGGLVGSNYFGRLSSSYSTGSVSGEDHIGNVGGLAGNNDGSIIINCYSTGVVTGGRYVGGLVGGYDWSNASIASSFWDMETSGQTVSTKGTGLTTFKMQSTSTFLEAGWDFIDETENGTDDIWWIDEGQDYPRLWWEGADAEF